MAQWTGVISPDGRTIAAADESGTMQVWSIAHPNSPTLMHTFKGGDASSIRLVSVALVCALAASGPCTQSDQILVVAFHRGTPSRVSRHSPDRLQ
jgi:hypothetical protein